MEKSISVAMPATSLAVDDLDSLTLRRLPVTLSGRLSLLARFGVLVFVLLCAYVNVMSIADLWSNSVSLTEISAAPGPAATANDIRTALNELGLSPTALAIFNVTTVFITVVSFYTVGTYLLRRKSNEALALIVVVFIFAMASARFPPDLARIQDAHPIRAALGLMIDGVWFLAFFGMFFLFPDGRFTPRWTSGVIAVFALFLLNEALSGKDSWGPPAPIVDAIMYGTLLITMTAAQIHRYRKISGPIEQQQTKWFLGGVGIALVVFVVLNITLVDHGAFQSGTPVKQAIVAQMLFAILWVPAQLCIPITLGVAVMQYRLFDVDVVINRALVYGGLSVSIVGIYALTVVGAGNLLNTGNSVTLSLIATVLVAIVFQPLRQRLQRGANRLLYGDRDDPYAVITRLGRRLESTLAPHAVLTTIVETTGDALKLPYVAIALGVNGQAEIVAARGDPIEKPLRFNLANHGESIGTLLVAPRSMTEKLSRADIHPLEDVALHAGPAVQAVRLTTDLQLARERLVLAREEERRRLRRDLHDGLGPRLAALTLRLETAHERLSNDPVADSLLSDLSQRTEEAVADIRRLVHNLRPPALDDLGMIAALRQTCESYGSSGPTSRLRHHPNYHCFQQPWR